MTQDATSCRNPSRRASSCPKVAIVGEPTRQASVPRPASTSNRSSQTPQPRCTAPSARASLHRSLPDTAPRLPDAVRRSTFLAKGKLDELRNFRSCRRPKLLCREGIYLNEAANGVCCCVCRASPSRRLRLTVEFTRTFTIANPESRLLRPAPGTLRDELRSIGTEIAQGTFPY